MEVFSEKKRPLAPGYFKHPWNSIMDEMSSP